MSAAPVTLLPPLPVRRRRGTESRRRLLESTAPLVSFAALAAFSAWTFARLETGPPQGRMIAVALLATLAGTVLVLSAGLSRPAIGPTVRVVVVLAALWLALLVTGVPAHDLWPTGWASLASSIGRGVTGLAGDRWPYRGSDPVVRQTLLLCVPVALVAAAALAFWPARGARRTRGVRRRRFR